MTAIELKDKSVAELQTQLEELLSDQFKLRMQKSTGQLGQSHLIKQTLLRLFLLVMITKIVKKEMMRLTLEVK